MCWYVKDGQALDFLHKLSKDPALQDDYKKNPEAVLDRHGLTADQKELLLTDDREKLVRELLGRHPVA